MSQRVRDLVMIAVFAALLCVLSPLSLPLPSGIPLTLQVFMVTLCGAVLGYRRGMAAFAVYLILGAVGLPVFAGFRGGIGVLLGVTGGYLWGFIPLVFLSGLAAKRRWMACIGSVLGLALCHLLGILQFAAAAGQDLFRAFWLSSAPYLIKDLGCVILAQLLRVPLRQALEKTGKY